MKNQCFVIHPYRVMGGVWVFDDETLGLRHEPFVGETNRVIDAILKSKNMPLTQFTAIFSSTPLPHADAEFTLKKSEGKSAWYWDSSKTVEFWLCGVVSRFFGRPPRKIYVVIQKYDGDVAQPVRAAS